MSESTETFAELFSKGPSSIKEGEVSRGVVLSVDEDYVQVDIGFKSEGLVQLPSYSEHWIESRHWLLKYHGNSVPPNFAHLFLAQLQEIVVSYDHLTVRTVSRDMFRQQPHDRFAGH